MHVCFGYAALVKGRPAAYSFLPQLAGCTCRGVSIETAQSNLDCAVLAELPGKRVRVGVLDLNDMTVETPELVADRLRRAMAHVPAEQIVAAPDCGMKYLPRDVVEKVSGTLEQQPATTVHTYPCADHAFDNPDFHLHHREASQDALQRTTAWLAEHLPVT